MIKNRKTVILFFILFAVLFFIFPQISHAADRSELFHPTDGDKSISMFLNKMFDLDNLEASPLSAILAVFNTAVLLIGGILAAYALVAGTMSTAHDGEMLGKRWSSMWLPIRTVIGTTFILPTMGGFCAAQFIVIWLMHQGVGLADNIWETYVKEMPKTAMAAYAGPDRTEAYNVASGAFMSNFCNILANNYYEKLAKESSGYDVPKFTRFDADGSVLGNTRVYYGVKGATTMSMGSLLPTSMYYNKEQACGRFEFKFDPKATESVTSYSVISLENQINALGNNDISGANDKIIENASKSNSKYGTTGNGGFKGMESLLKAQVSSFNKVDEQMRDLAQRYYDSKDKPAMQKQVYEEILKASQSYSKELRDNGKVIFEGVDSDGGRSGTWEKFASNMTESGWMYAGAWYIQLYRIQSLIGGLTKQVPEYTKMTDLDTFIRDPSKAEADMYNMIQNIATLTDSFQGSDIKDQLAKEYRENNGREGKASLAESGGPTSGWIAKKVYGELKNVITEATNGIITYAADNNEYKDSPLMLAYFIGDKLEWVFWGMLALVLTASILPSGFAAAAAAFLAPLTSTIFIISNMLTVILPFMPFFLWMGAILGWVLLCIEAVIASPLWVMIHIHPDGDGVVGRGGAGYGLVLSLTVRPALMIIGLVCSLIIMGIFAQIINEIFLIAFYTISNRAGISILQLPIMVGTYAMALYLVIKKSYALIHIIPDEVLKWLGVNHGGSMKEAATGGVQAMMAARYMDDKAQNMSLDKAVNAGKQKTAQINKDIESNNATKAAKNLDSDNSKVNAALGKTDTGEQDPNGASINGASGDSARWGQSANEQLTKADQVIRSAEGAPLRTLDDSELEQQKEAHQVKAENINKVLSSSGLSENSAVGAEMRSSIQNSQSTIGAIEAIQKARALEKAKKGPDGGNS